MADSTQIITDSQFSIIKLKNSLEQLANRAKATDDANTLLAEATALFKDFFDNLKDPEFKPVLLSKGDTPRSEDYNDNLQLIYNDLARFYKELENLADANIKSFNYSQVVVNEIRKRASFLASTVLDLSILSNFTKGDVIVAGDDFLNLDNISTDAALGSPQAELISNGAGLSLARATTNNLSLNSATTITITPIKPTSTAGNDVNTGPTPGNFERFYEGNYYNFIGEARPEGGSFNIQMIVRPSDISTQTENKPGPIVNPDGTPSDDVLNGINDNGIFGKKANSEDDPTEGLFIEYGASQEAKESSRKKMLDGNPDTFWECEYLLRLDQPLIPNIDEAIVINDEVEAPSEGYASPEGPSSASIQIDVNDLNNRALAKDKVDLAIDIVITLPEDQNVNFVSINPVIFGKKAFISVEDIATINSTESEFTTVDNWDSIRFPKTITPEANEFLTDSQLKTTLAPSRYAYTGQGIYPFPTRVANRIKIRVNMVDPVSQIYERTYVLMKNDINITTTTTTTVKTGGLRKYF